LGDGNRESIDSKGGRNQKPKQLIISLMVALNDVLGTEFCMLYSICCNQYSKFFSGDMQHPFGVYVSYFEQQLKHSFWS
jgi:hypothetical protein